MILASAHQKIPAELIYQPADAVLAEDVIQLAQQIKLAETFFMQTSIELADLIIQLQSTTP